MHVEGVTWLVLARYPCRSWYRDMSCLTAQWTLYQICLPTIPKKTRLTQLDRTSNVNEISTALQPRSEMFDVRQVTGMDAFAHNPPDEVALH
jgi:hypothetical protein